MDTQVIVIVLLAAAVIVAAIFKQWALALGFGAFLVEHL